MATALPKIVAGPGCRYTRVPPYRKLFLYHFEYSFSRTFLAKILKNIREDRKIIEVFIANQNAQADENAKRLSGMRFLEKYMYLGTCNLFFADKIIMVEGITEKIILPQLLKKIRYIQLNMV
ncbi:TOPRIM nucleotidyl transferase/hydrolase domain-containing protein [Alistipes ihumii]|uniref:TOPRIM nucleotidyl transferase/hydrolase domain-containing protein n=1 Tax=Alistipes ihumii TaxID=1470347 RepID=UPI0027B8A655|nr:TOPRIM nucleotidyl transferase/hydrolase domain-containing protein [Alistipes ihumii]